VIHRPIDVAVHRYLLNRGIVVTPFHNMLLICPATSEAHVDRLIALLDSCISELFNEHPA
jgi:glutamate-1-semialdehyde 2,1-aminomutase